MARRVETQFDAAPRHPPVKKSLRCLGGIDCQDYGGEPIGLDVLHQVSEVSLTQILRPISSG
jgi:hypothetical protein